MEMLACGTIASRIKADEVYLVIVSQGCSFCQQVLAEIEHYGFKMPFIVVNADVCQKELEGLKYEYLPMAIHFSGGKTVRQAVGVDEIRDFDKPKTTDSAPAQVAEEGRR